MSGTDHSGSPDNVIRELRGVRAVERAVPFWWEGSVSVNAILKIVDALLVVWLLGFAAVAVVLVFSVLRGTDKRRPSCGRVSWMGGELLDGLIALIRDDGYAATFQTLGQYRSAILRAAQSVRAQVSNKERPT